MNRTSKLIFSASAALVVMGSAAPVFAERSVTTKSPEKTTTPFCTNLTSKTNDIGKNITKLEEDISTAKTNRVQKLNDGWANKDRKLGDARSGWATWRQKQFATLEAEATTDAQKAAVKIYETTLTTAISTRESANDAARNTYRNGVLAAINTQIAQANSQISAFTSAVQAAEATAASSCASNPSDASIRTTFIAAMKIARQNFVSARKNDDKIATQIKTLATARDATIHANELTFKKAENAAMKTLLTAFPGASTDSSSGSATTSKTE